MTTTRTERAPVRRARTRAGIERVLHRAAGDPAFRDALLADRRRAVAAAGLALGPAELAVLDTVPADRLAASIDALEPAQQARRSFMKAVAALSAGTVGVIELAACHEESSTGVRPDPVDGGETTARAVLDPEATEDATAPPIPRSRIAEGDPMRTPAALLLALGLVACGDTPGSGQNQNGNGNGSDAAVDLDAASPDATTDASVAPDAGGPERPRFQVCVEDPVPTDLPTVEWNHTTSAITVATGDPGHSAQDPITVVGRAEPIVGKFAYGAISTDLQDEWVEVWLDRCEGALVKLGEALTDTDGRIALEIPAADLPPVGAYATWLRVKGDGSSTRSVLRVVLPNTHVAVMDIDGTLTTSDTELFQDIFADLFVPLGTGDYVPVARAGAVDLTTRRGPEQGYLIVFMTGRPYYLTDISRGWLADLAMAPGHLHLTDSNAEAMPTESGVGTYKADYLAHLQSMGLLLDLAYGNATTDIYAYAQAGVDPAVTFIVGDNGGTDGTVALGDDYVAHLQTIAAEPAIVQPFDW